MKQLKISGEISTLSESVDVRTLYKTDSTNLDIPTYDLVDKVSSNTRDNYTYISVLSLSKYFVRNKSLCSLQGDIESGGKYGFELLKDKQAFNQIKFPKNFSFANSNYTNIGGYAFTFSEYSDNNLESFYFTGTDKAVVKIGEEKKHISSSRFP